MILNELRVMFIVVYVEAEGEPFARDPSNRVHTTSTLFIGRTNTQEYRRLRCASNHPTYTEQTARIYILDL